MIPVYLIAEENTYPIAEMREGKALKGKNKRIMQNEKNLIRPARCHLECVQVIWRIKKEISGGVIP